MSDDEKWLATIGMRLRPYQREMIRICTPECEDDNVPDDQVKRAYCAVCHAELSSYLDAYHGTDQEAAKCCVRCRR